MAVPLARRWCASGLKYPPPPGEPPYQLPPPIPPAPPPTDPEKPELPLDPADVTAEDAASAKAPTEPANIAGWVHQPMPGVSGTYQSGLSTCRPWAATSARICAHRSVSPKTIA